MTNPFFFQILIILGIILGLFLLSLAIYLSIMHRKRNIVAELSDCKVFLISRYSLWLKSFTCWTCLEYFLLITPIISSAATVYFSAEILSDKSNKAGAVCLSVFSFLSALLPLIRSKIRPQMHADHLYKGLVTLEQGLLRHKEGLITTVELLNMAKRAESFTNILLKERKNQKTIKLYRTSRHFKKYR